MQKELLFMEHVLYSTLKSHNSSVRLPATKVNLCHR